MATKKNNKKAKNVVSNFEAQNRRRNLISAGIIGGVVLLLIVAAAYGIKSNSVDRNRDLIVPDTLTEDYGVVYKPSDAGADPALDEQVKAHIVIYEDFSCPFCQQFEQIADATFMQLVADGKADIEYRMVGFLDDRGAANNHSKRTAAASICVLDENGIEGWKKFHDWAYENQPVEGQPGPTDNEYVSAIEGELELKLAKDCLRSETYIPLFQEATDKFNADQIGGTPAVFVNGEEVETSPLEIVKAVDAANAAA